MAWTHERFTFSRRLQLGHEELCRPVQMGTHWQSVRIGIRHCINDAVRTNTNGTYPSASSTYLGFGVYLGMKQGTTTSFFSSSLTDWIGGGLIGSGYPASGYLTFVAGSPNYWEHQSGNRPNGLWKTGASTVFGTEFSITACSVGSGAGGGYGAGTMSCLFVDILKGSPNYTITVYYMTSGTVINNITDAAFLTALESTGTPANMTAAAAKTIAYTGAGLFDTLSIASNRCYPHLELDIMAVCRLT